MARVAGARLSKSPVGRSKAADDFEKIVGNKVSKLNYSDDFDNLTDSLSDISTYYGNVEN